MNPILLALEDKYRKLTWYARSDFEDLESWKDVDETIRKEAFKQKELLEKEYPGDIDALNNCEAWMFHEGFNAGVLAGLRFNMTTDEHGIKTAVEEFPDLDT